MPEIDLEIYKSIVLAIIKEQENIIGPVAIMQANVVKGIELQNGTVQFTTDEDPKIIVHRLVEAYAELFGRASIELSKEAVRYLNPPKNILPKVLM